MKNNNKIKHEIIMIKRNHKKMKKNIISPHSPLLAQYTIPWDIDIRLTFQINIKLCNDDNVYKIYREHPPLMVP